MARVNLLNIYNASNKETSIDSFLRKVGGTSYTNCYTPAPDTPRSLACMQTGLYPFKNGCDSRIKWPKFFLNDVGTFFDVLNSKGFQQIFYMTREHYNTGPFNHEYGSVFHDYDDFLDSVKTSIDSDNDLFAYISLQDYHWAIDDYGGTKEGVKKGQDKLVDFTEIFFQDVDIDIFDYTLIFSDHGHKTNSEILNFNSLELLNDDRSKILMHIRKKFEVNNSVNRKLCSILDVPNTVRDMLGLKFTVESGDGISLFSKKYHNSLVLEDHLSFDVSPNQSIEQWSYVSKDEVYITNIKDSVYLVNGDICDISKEKELNFIKNIAIKSPQLLDYKKKIKVLNFYKALKVKSDKYSDGSVRDEGGSILQLKNLYFKIRRRMGL